MWLCLLCGYINPDNADICQGCGEISREESQDEEIQIEEGEE